MRENLIIIVSMLIVLFFIALVFALKYFKLKSNKITSTTIDNIKDENLYKRKQFMTNSELSFYNKIKDLNYNYNIVPQLNLATVIKKIKGSHFQNELYRNIDFAIFTKDYSKLLLLIELNDQTHNEKKRKKRDLNVKNICSDADIKLIKFYTKYPNEKEYVINRILKEIENIDKY